jgi:hypothetical protein
MMEERETGARMCPRHRWEWFESGDNCATCEEERSEAQYPEPWRAEARDRYPRRVRRTQRRENET